MTFDTLATLSTGDLVKNDQTGVQATVVMVEQHHPGLTTIEKLRPTMDQWSIAKSRTTITKAELERIAEWHAKMKEIAEGKK